MKRRNGGQDAHAPIRWLGVTAFLMYLLCSSWRFPIGGDGRATLATARSLVTHQTFAIDAQFASDEGYTPRAKIGVDGRAYGVAGLGFPLVEMPFVAVALGVSRLVGVPESQAIVAVLSPVNPLLTALSVIVVFSLCRSIGSPAPAAILAAAMYSLGTLAWVYAGVDGTEPLQALCLALGLLFALDDRGGPAGGRLAVSSMALTFAVITKPANAVLVPAFIVFVIAGLRGLQRRRALRALVYFIAPLAAGCAFLVWLNWIRFGSIFETGYDHDMFRNPFLRGLYGLVLSFNKGIVMYSPLVLLVPSGIWMMKDTHRREAVLIALASASYVSLFATFDLWGAGWAFGPRYLVPLLPLLMLPVARAMATTRLRRALALVLFAAGFVVNGLGVLVDGDAYHSTLMTVDLSSQTGFVRIGSVLNPGQLVNMPVPPEDVLPEFSEIAGKLWLARVACAGCWCDERTARCVCPEGAMDDNRTFLRPPWAARYPNARPEPPYGTRLLNPWIADRIHEWLARS